MAALGLGVDVRVVAGAGVKATLALQGRFLLSGLMSYGPIRYLGGDGYNFKSMIAQ